MFLLSALFVLSAAGTGPIPSCLHHVASTRTVVVSPYDVSYDKRGDSSISCNFGLTASEAADDLNAMLQAAKSCGCERLVAVSNSPLSVELQGGRTMELSKKDVCRYRAKIQRFLLNNRESFAPDHLNLLGWRGAFLGSSRILVNTVKDSAGRPHLKLVAIGPI